MRSWERVFQLYIFLIKETDDFTSEWSTTTLNNVNISTRTLGLEFVSLFSYLYRRIWKAFQCCYLKYKGETIEPQKQRPRPQEAIRLRGHRVPRVSPSQHFTSSLSVSHYFTSKSCGYNFLEKHHIYFKFYWIPIILLLQLLDRLFTSFTKFWS